MFQYSGRARLLWVKYFGDHSELTSHRPSACLENNLAVVFGRAVGMLSPFRGHESFGITLDEFACLADCNGASASLVRPVDSKEQYEEFIQTVHRVCTGGRLKQSDGEKNFDEENPEELMAISYSRKTLGQTGDGHFSPIAALDVETNSVLIFDTARFKYPPHWVPLDLLFQSMLPVDNTTGKSRGYVVLKAKCEYQGRKVCCILKEPTTEDVLKDGLPEPKPVYESGKLNGTACIKCWESSLVSITGCVFLVGKWAPHFKWSRSYVFHPTETEELKEAGSHNVRHLNDCKMITELS